MSDTTNETMTISVDAWNQMLNSHYFLRCTVAELPKWVFTEQQQATLAESKQLWMSGVNACDEDGDGRTAAREWYERTTGKERPAFPKYTEGRVW
jgi:hypothetical protein